MSTSHADGPMTADLVGSERVRRHPHSVSFVSVTQRFCTTTSMGRLTLKILLSFAQFERD